MSDQPQDRYSDRSDRSDRSSRGGFNFLGTPISHHSRSDIVPNLRGSLFQSPFSATGTSNHTNQDHHRFTGLGIDPSSDHYGGGIHSQGSTSNLPHSSSSQHQHPPHSTEHSVYSSTTSEVPIQGTTIQVNKVTSAIDRFLRTYRPPITLNDGTVVVDEEQDPHYKREILALLLGDKTYLNVNLDHFKGEYSEELESNMLFFPSEMVLLFDSIVNQYANELRLEVIENVRALHHQRQQQRLENPNHLASASDAALDLIDPADAQALLQHHGVHNHWIQVRPYSQTLLNSMRALNPSDIDTLVSIRGMVLRLSTIKPELKEGFFECSAPGCGHELRVPVVGGVIREPQTCPRCQRKNTMELQHNRSVYASKQVIKLQETPEDMDNGETPQTISVWVYDDLVDSVKAGDRVVITGIYKAQTLRVNPDHRTVKDKLYTYLDALHFRLVSAGSKTSSEVDGTTRDVGLGLQNADQFDDFLTEEQEEAFHRLAQHPHIYDILIRSIAPSVWGNDDVKKGLLCLMFGGSSINGLDTMQSTDHGGMGGFDPNLTGGSKRGRQGTIHVLLVGDPGTAKSQLLQYVHKLSARGVYTSGTASSAAGLTASVTRDPIQGEMVLESGALVISDGGVCCIDEFDKMSDSAQSILHEAMEQQTISIAKAGVICTLSARTSILASANPTDSRYNPHRSIVQNINLSPSLLSRFDLIYIMLDIPDRNQDYFLAEHLLTMFMDEDDQKDYKAARRQQQSRTGYQPQTATGGTGPSTSSIDDTQSIFGDIPLSEHTTLPTKELMAYINYARQMVNPVLTDEAVEELEHSYLKFRGVEDANTSAAEVIDGNAAASFNTTISATTRQLHSLIKISEALAKMQLKDAVTRQHVQEATRLILSATLSSAIDPTTGLIDMGSITTGISTAERVQLAANQSADPQATPGVGTTSTATR